MTTWLLCFVTFVLISVCFGGFTKVGNNPQLKDWIQVNDIGSDIFNISKLSNWHYEVRYPLISPRTTGEYQNIYAANIVNNGEETWAVYFGGWDGVAEPHDAISITVTTDTFETFNPHYSQITAGVYNEINNPNAIKINNTFWVMMYTILAPFQPPWINKPGYSTCTNGINWIPNSGEYNYMITMIGYPFNWTNADVNGGNVIYFDGDKYHLYFDDTRQASKHSVFHAISSDLKNWEYQNIALSEPYKIANDMKKINGHYIMGLHFNTQHVWYSISDDLTSFPKSNILFSNLTLEDSYIVSMGFVINEQGNRLMGVLYGATNSSQLLSNNIYGIWLQKKVLFINNNTVLGMGDMSRSYGPDNVLIDMEEKESVVGQFYLYDTDYVDVNNRGTLLCISNQVTIKQGDIWQYTA